MSTGSRHTASLGAGVLVVGAALLSPLNGLAHQLFSAHMVQHLLLILAAAPLAVYGAPAAGRQVRRKLPGVPPWARPALLVGAVHAAVVWLWHLPGPYQAALGNHGLHAAEHLTMFGTAVAFWALVIGGPSGRRLSHPAAAALVLFTAAQSGALGAILSFASRGLYPVHSAGAAAAGLTLLEDQQLAGAIMWIPAGAIYLVTIVVLMVRALSALEKAGLGGAVQ